MDKRFMVILSALVIIFGGIFFFTQKSTNNSVGSSGGQPTNHVTNQGKTGVKLIEYGDYQCSACESYEPMVEQIIKSYSEQIYFQFRNLPLIQLHPNAFAAARAAEAAGLQNKYWQMHDALYQPTNWQSWTIAGSPASLFESYATQIGLNLEQFKQDYSSSKANDAINADLAEFKKTGQQQATPAFFLDGVFLDNSKLIDPSTNQPSATKLAALIDAAIAAKNKK